MLCSVVIPTHNCLEFLKHALNSVLIQNVDCEIIVVDDGSTDGTAEYLAYRNDVKVINTHKIGASAARNEAIKQASGEYIAFLDADDIWWHGKLKKQLDFHMENADVVLSFTDYLHFNEEGTLLGGCFAYWNSPLTNKSFEFTHLKDAESFLLATNVVGTSTVVARKDKLLEVNGFRTDLKSSEDWDLWLKLASVGKVGFSSSCLMSYLMRAGSISSAKDKRINAIQTIIEPYKNKEYFKNAYKAALGRIHLAKAEFEFSKNNKLKTFYYNFLGLIALPSKRNFISMILSLK